ncbi:MAG: tetratricopeptide repeat protein [Armatimonadetes bacterium]|nr:tetratricopeptide repeat protein [Armatimonadota bacterium]
MSDVQGEQAQRAGMMPENVVVLVLAALLAGLLIGQALGRRQGLEVKQVAIAPNSMNPHAGMEMGMGGSDADLAASAPKAPESVEEARQMVELMGADADVEGLIDLGNRKFDNGVYFLAIGFYLKALEKDPKRPDVWCDLGAAYHAVKHDDEALKAFDQALSQNPKHANSWFNRGVVYRDQKQRDKAVEAFGQYLKLQPAGEQADRAKAALKELGQQT